MSTEIIEKLKQAVGPEKVKTDEATLNERRRDWSVTNALADMQGRGAPNPACVVNPKKTEDVVNVVKICNENKALLVPFGLGSGCMKAIHTTPETVLLDMSSMKRVRKIDKKNLIATFEAGIRGADAENAVAKEGMMIGHYPQSIDVSSVGGWVATRASGQFSSAYGSIEDVVMALEVVLPNGEVLETRLTPRAAAGPDLNYLFLGSEGTLGIITTVMFSLRWKAEKREYTAFYAPNMEQGFELQRYIIQSGWTPPVMRQYDTSETKRIFEAHARGDDCLLIMVHEGPKGRVEAEIKECQEIAKDLKCDPAPTEAVAEWLENRNNVHPWETWLEQDIILDTIEMAATWDKIGPIYRNAVASLNKVDGMLNATAHSSHCYRSGINLYFTFAAKASDPLKMEEIYYDCWNRVMEAIIEGGGGISHHHGIGRVRRDYMSAEIGESGVNLLRKLKKILDPNNILNPDILIPHE
ncbi:MAG: FAD-binding oxidoreductase [Deltaproteobacteria bacterium]|nr:FAD-binding oxidoreductase [Deltaproteobacteria bacterium]